MSKQPEKLSPKRERMPAKRLYKELEEMRRNPQGDWKISDLAKICKNFGLRCSEPSGGSHYKISSPCCKGF